MEENKTFFNYVSQVFATFGMIVLIFMILSMVVGNLVIGYSSLSLIHISEPTRP